MTRREALAIVRDGRHLQLFIAVVTLITQAETEAIEALVSSDDSAYQQWQGRILALRALKKTLTQDQAPIQTQDGGY